MYFMDKYLYYDIKSYTLYFILYVSNLLCYYNMCYYFIMKLVCSYPFLLSLDLFTFY